MAQFGSPTPRVFGNGASVPTFPQAGSTWTHPTLPIVVPAGSLDRWFAYRATTGAARGEVVGIGDSTMYGSGGLYSFLQRLRDRAVSAGITDGGKGMFAGGEGIPGTPIAYDAPEVNGFVSSTWVGSPDGYDNTDGQYYYDNGAAANRTLVLQFYGTCARLWHSRRTAAGDFTYSVADGATVVASGTVQAYMATSGPDSRFTYISGLAAGVLHTITITNLALSTSGGPGSGAACWVALAPMNDTGLVWQKYATSGDTMNNRFYGQLASTPFTQSQYGMRYQTSFGLTPTTVTSAASYRGATVDTAYAAGARVKPVLAMSNLGFNDLTSAATGDDAMWTEYVKRFAGACYDAGCGGIILSGQLPYNAQWPTWGAARYNALKTQALASGLAWADTFYPVAGGSLSYAGGTQNPHLTKVQYQAQADFLWDNLLGLPL